MALHVAGDLDTAERLYQRAAAARPGDANAHNLLGVVARQRGDARGALRHTGRAVALQPEAPVFLANHGVEVFRLDAIAFLVKRMGTSCQNQPEVHAITQALRAVARRHDFPERWPLDLIAGFAMDVDGQRYDTPEDTLRYAYHVAGVVGVMMARIMGVRDDGVLDRASDLGLAFQLTNIARDVIGDARIGRLYLPGDWLEEAGASVEGNIPSPQLYGVILRLLDAAEPYYASAFAGLPALPARCAWSIAAAARIYRAIGTRIRRGGPEAYRQRIGTSGAAKAGLAVLALGDAGVSRVIPRQVPRDGLWTRPRA